MKFLRILALWLVWGNMALADSPRDPFVFSPGREPWVLYKAPPPREAIQKAIEMEASGLIHYYGTAKMGNKEYAVINDQIVQRGGMMDGLQLIAVQPDSVTLRRGSAGIQIQIALEPEPPPHKKEKSAETREESPQSKPSPAEDKHVEFDKEKLEELKKLREVLFGGSRQSLPLGSGEETR